MARVCTICSHPRVSEIDTALLANTPYRSVAKQYEASESSMFRHSKEHLPVSYGEGGQAVVLSPSEPDAITAWRSGADVLKYMVQVQKRTLSILESASAAGRHETALKAIRETRENLQLIAKLKAELRDGGDTLDLRKLTAEEIGLLLQATLGEMSAREREALLLESPELSDFVKTQQCH